MNSEIKKNLLEKLSETFDAIQTAIDGADLEQRVYMDTDWRIRDILGHIATWDQEITKALEAFVGGIVYLTPDIGEDESEFNEKEVLKQRMLSTQELLIECVQAREGYISALSAIPEDMFPGDMLFPWGDERGTIAELVHYMLDHDEEHRQEIREFLQASTNK